MKLLGKVAIVTGGSGHIGRAAVEELVKEGADVVSTFLTDKINADLLSQQIKSVKLMRCDVRKLEDIKKVVEATINEFKKIDILVNNAGSGVKGPVETITEEGWDMQFDVDLKGSFLFSKSVIPTMKKQHYGKIINISSIVAITGTIGHTAHAAAKAGLIAFTRNLAMEMAQYNINVNCIAPGIIEANYPKKIYQKWAENLIPLKRVGKPEDVAKLVVFLASSDSDFITGQTLIIDGGHSVFTRYS